MERRIRAARVAMNSDEQNATHAMPDPEMRERIDETADIKGALSANGEQSAMDADMGTVAQIIRSLRLAVQVFLKPTDLAGWFTISD